MGQPLPGTRICRSMSARIVPYPNASTRLHGPQYVYPTGRGTARYRPVRRPEDGLRRWWVATEGLPDAAGLVLARRGGKGGDISSSALPWRPTSKNRELPPALGARQDVGQAAPLPEVRRIWQSPS